MRRFIIAALSLFVAGALTGAANAAEAPARTDTALTVKAVEGAKVDRRGYSPPRYGHPPRYRQPPRHGHYRQPVYHTPCWRENRYSYFRSRPAYVSVRLCRDRYGRVYTVDADVRLIRYTQPPRRHHRGRW